jgi:hypothetical protein
MEQGNVCSLLLPKKASNNSQIKTPAKLYPLLSFTLIQRVTFYIIMKYLISTRETCVREMSVFEMCSHSRGVCIREVSIKRDLDYILIQCVCI